MQSPRSILITGASSGIGEGLALLYAAPGVHLALSGRDSGRLGEVAAKCRAKGAAVLEAVLDVADRDGMARWIMQADDANPLELVIANAGISSGLASLAQIDETTRSIFAANVDGVFNTVHPVVGRMAARGRGQIALMASLASFRGLPGSAAYSASKAAVRVYGEALRGQLAGKGIEVSVICPGYVKSRMTDRNKFPMPFLMDTDKACALIARRLARNDGRIAFPWPTFAMVWLLAALPDMISGWMTSRLPAKE